MPYSPPIILDFSQGSNKVVQFLTTAPGTVFSRVIDFALGTGGTTYAPFADDRSAIYCVNDDKMYFLAEKTGTEPFGEDTWKVVTTNTAAGTNTIISPDGTGTPILTTASSTNGTIDAIRINATGSISGRLILEQVSLTDNVVTTLFSDDFTATGNFVARSPDVGTAYAIAGGGSLADPVVGPANALPTWITASAPISTFAANADTQMQFSFHADDGVASTGSITIIQYNTAAYSVELVKTTIAFDLVGDFWVITQTVRNSDNSIVSALTTDHLTGLPVTSSVLVQYDPRTLAVSDDMELPADWDTANSVLVDVADERAWISSSFDGTTRAFDLVSMTQVFTDGGDFGSAPFAVSSAAIAADSGHLLLVDSVDPLTFHRITVTGATTYTDDTGTTAGSAVWANNGSYRRRWIATDNKVIVTYEGAGPGLGAIIDVAALTVDEIPMPAGWSIGFLTGMSNNGIFWDPFTSPTNVFVCSVNYTVAAVDHFGIGVFTTAGALVGVAALDGGTGFWNEATPAMPIGVDVAGAVGMILSSGGSGVFGAGGFSTAAPTTTPVETYESDNFQSIPTVLDFEFIHSCVALSVSVGEPTLTTVASVGGSIGTALTDSATLSGGEDPTGTITFFLFGPDDDTCGLEPIFTSDPITVTGNGTYVSSPVYIPVVAGTYRWTAVYSGDENNDPVETECNAINETSIITETPPPQGGGGSPGNCGVQFERLELFHLLKSLMGGGRTLKEALKFVDQDDIDFLEEEGYMDDLPLEIPKPMRQGNSPKMVSTRIDLTPITKLNRLIDEFETKLQDCVHRSVGEYEK